MTSEGLGEGFKGDYADTCARLFSLASIGGQGNSQACAGGERGPPSKRAEIFKLFLVVGWVVAIMMMKLGNSVEDRAASLDLIG